MCVWFAVLNMVGQGRLVESYQLSKDFTYTASLVTFDVYAKEVQRLTLTKGVWRRMIKCV